MLTGLPDIELWIAFKEGNRDAFGELFHRHYPLLFKYGIKLCHDRSLLEDCIQELFIELWQNKSNRDVNSVKAYLLKALKYKIFKSYRTAVLQNNAVNTDDLAFNISHETLLIDREESRQEKDRILDALLQLPNRQKEIIYLKIYQGLSYEEVSEIMDINYQAARNLFHQSIKSLRKILA